MTLVRQCVTLRSAAGSFFVARTVVISDESRQDEASAGLSHQRIAHNQAREDKGLKSVIDEEFAALRSHRDRIHRYRRLLATQPTGHERQDLERRLREEHSAFDALIASKFPLVFKSSLVVDREKSVSVTTEDAIL